MSSRTGSVMRYVHSTSNRSIGENGGPTSGLAL